MKKFLYKLWAKFLVAFGNIKVFKYPMFLVYDPDDYKVDGYHTLLIMKRIQKGDVILRGYEHYLDGMFVPGDYSHAGVYVGDGIIVHATAPSVEKISLLDFVKCDRIAIFRPSSGVGLAIQLVGDYLQDDTPYDFLMTEGDSALYCFELAALAYPYLKVEKVKPELFGGWLTRSEKAYLGESFFKSPDFIKVFEFNPKRGVDE